MHIIQTTVTEKEAELLRAFRGLNAKGRVKALERLNDMTMISWYTDKSGKLIRFDNGRAIRD